MFIGSPARRSGPLRLRTALTGAISICLVLAVTGTAFAAGASKVIVKSKPSRTTRSTTAVFRFATGAAGGRFRCRFDGGPWLACKSPLKYTAIVAGRHTLGIRSATRAGKPVTVAWTVHPAAARAPQIKVTYLGSDASGVAAYDVVSPDDGSGPQILRVLKPTNPAPGVPHNFLYALPVETGVGTTYGDGIETLAQIDAQDKYNLTIVEPSFPVEPWYANSSTDPNTQYETFMVDDLVPWVTQNLATTGQEQNWLLGFSKSGFGAQDLILKHPDVFTAAASWDFPADMTTSTADGTLPVGDGLNYATDANFQSNYRLTPSFVQAHSGPFQTKQRIWIGSYAVFRTDVANYNTLLTSTGIKHLTEKPHQTVHNWGSGWVPVALSALSTEAAALPPGP
jgi:hypothetical protein